MEKERRRKRMFSEEEVDLLKRKLQFTDLFGQLRMVEGECRRQAEKAIKRAMQSTVMLWGGLRCGAAPDSETLRTGPGIWSFT